MSSKNAVRLLRGLNLLVIVPIIGFVGAVGIHWLFTPGQPRIDEEGVTISAPGRTEGILSTSGILETSPRMPQTDEDVRAILLGEDPGTGHLARHNIYVVFRNRDGLSVEDAYMKTLDHIIALYEGGE